MYSLPYHKEANPLVVNQFIKQHPFSFLTGCDSKNQPVATQVPLFFKENNGRKVLQGHIMKNSDHHKAFLQNKNVLAVFTGKHAYVSGTWYKNPYSPSTWNYMSVHIKGTVSFVRDKELKELLQLTSLHFEKYNEQSTTVFNNLPASFKQKALPLIVGFEIEITQIDTVFKLSQDRDMESYQNIIDALKKQDEDSKTIALEMEKRKKELFEKNDKT